MADTITFDAGDTSGYTLGGSHDFGGTASSLAATPPAGGSGSAAKVVKPANAETWAGTTFLQGSGAEFVTAANHIITMKVWAENAGDIVRLKLEDAHDNTHTLEVDAVTTVAGGWQTLTFDFTKQVAGTAALNDAYTYDKASVFFDFGKNGAEKTFYFDDVAYTATAVAAPDPDPAPSADPVAGQVTFDAGDTSGYTLGGSHDFGGTASSLAATPPAGGSGSAAKVVKPANAETWAGTTFLQGSGAEFVTAANHTITMKVWAENAGDVVRLKLEDAHDNTHTLEVDAVTTVAGGWQTLTFDFTKQVAGTAALDDAYTYDKASVFFDFGRNGAEKTFYFDDVAYTATAVAAPDPEPEPDPDPAPDPASPPPVQVTFDANDKSGYTLGAFDFGGAASALATTPPAGASGGVAQVIKTAGAQTWAGSTFLILKDQEAVTAANHVVTMKVWSPEAGSVVLLKFEDDKVGAHSIETQAVTTVAGGWQTLTFDLTKTSPGTPAFSDAYTYNKASVFFDFGNTGSGKTYYFDDVAFTPSPTPPGIQLTFDPDDGSGYTLGGNHDFEGAASSLAAAPPSGASGSAAKVIKTDGAKPWAGTTFVKLSDEKFFTEHNHLVTMKVWSPEAGSVVLLKVEDSTNPAHSVETQAVTTVAGGWQTLTFDLLKNNPNTPALDDGYTYDQASVFFDFGNAGTGKTYYFDDVGYTTTAVEPPPPPPDPEPVPPPVQVTFDAGDASGYALGAGHDASGVTSSVAAAPPAGASGHAGKVVKAATADASAGTNFLTLHGSELASSEHHTMTMKVWSADAGVDVHLRLEDAADASYYVEAAAATTVAGGWETLTFDFLDEAPNTQAFDDSFTYDKATVIFDAGHAATGTKTYYFDDVAYTASSVAAPPPPGAGPAVSTARVTFDASGTAWKLGADGDFGGASSSVAATPPAGGWGSAAKVVKAAGAEAWAGTTFVTSDHLITEAHNVITMSVWSPAKGSTVRLMLTDANDVTHTVEADATTGVANGWQTLAFTFARTIGDTPLFDDTANFNKATVFFDFGNEGSGKTWYFDNVANSASWSAPLNVVTLDRATVAEFNALQAQGNVLVTGTVKDGSTTLAKPNFYAIETASSASWTVSQGTTASVIDAAGAQQIHIAQGGVLHLGAANGVNDIYFDAYAVSALNVSRIGTTAVFTDAVTHAQVASIATDAVHAPRQVLHFKDGDLALTDNGTAVALNGVEITVVGTNVGASGALFHG